MIANSQHLVSARAARKLVIIRKSRNGSSLIAVSPSTNLHLCFYTGLHLRKARALLFEVGETAS